MPHLSLATRWLYRMVESGKIKLAFRKDFHQRLAYHTACHMERMGWAIYSTELLRMIPGVELTLLDSNCCGISSTYGFKKENYKRSQGYRSAALQADRGTEARLRIDRLRDL